MGAIFNFLFNPNGRVSRSDFWLKFWLPSVAAAIVALIIDFAIDPSLLEPSTSENPFGNQGIVSNLVSLFYLFPAYVAVPVKRLHDRGMSGWWQLLFAVLMIIGLGMLIGGGLMASGGNEGGVMIGLVLVGLLLVLAVGITQLILFGFLPGQKMPNQYGPDPLNPNAGTADTFA